MPSTHYHALLDLPSRIKSSLTLTEIEFPAYKPDELCDVLKDRAEFSFKTGSLNKNLIKIAIVAAEGDARVGLQIIRIAGKRADDRKMSRVTIDEIKHAIGEAKKTRASCFMNKLNKHQRVIYDILGKWKTMPSGLLYKEYRKRISDPVVDRAYRNYMRKLTDLGLVKNDGSGRW